MFMLTRYSGINQWIIIPRVEKDKAQQQKRTRNKAEVFTPSWICNKMNNICDNEWFGRANVFNTEIENKWISTKEKIEFSSSKTWQKYVDLRKLEITCGEAPYICSRYDMTTGEIISLDNRIGMLDRKIRVINENTTNKKDWIDWVIRAFQSTYGYELQGDNLIIARINLLLTFYEYYFYMWQEEPTKTLLRKIANIISWNIRQMDGLKGTVPNKNPNKLNEQLSFSNFFDEQEKIATATECKIHNWRTWRSLYYSELKGVKSKMKFDFCIGNPPYQENIDTRGEQPPVYHYMYDNNMEIADRVLLITPARFLFNAGKTPKNWNERMLNDTHFKILEYWESPEEIFHNVEIKGGVAIGYINNKMKFGAIRLFVKNELLRNIIYKVKDTVDNSLSSILYSNTSYKYSKKFFEKNPNYVGRVSGGSRRYLSSSIFDKYPEEFYDIKPEKGKYIKIIGRQNQHRANKYFLLDYLLPPSNFESYKVFMSSSNGNGKFGETLTMPFVGEPFVGATETFISFGNFSTREYALNLIKYLCTKFLRTMLGVRKVTQGNKNSQVWELVPLQDFTEKSDIDWSKSIHEIDLQLYKKYGLDETEIDFIEKM